MFLLAEALASSLLVSFFVIVLFKFGVFFMYKRIVVTVSLRKYFTQHESTFNIADSFVTICMCHVYTWSSKREWDVGRMNEKSFFFLQR